jgi:hypothetical protein
MAVTMVGLLRDDQLFVVLCALSFQFCKKSVHAHTILSEKIVRMQPILGTKLVAIFNSTYEMSQ